MYFFSMSIGPCLEAHRSTDHLNTHRPYATGDLKTLTARDLRLLLWSVSFVFWDLNGRAGGAETDGLLRRDDRGLVQEPMVQGLGDSHSQVARKRLDGYLVTVGNQCFRQRLLCLIGMLA